MAASSFGNIFASNNVFKYEGFKSFASFFRTLYWLGYYVCKKSKFLTSHPPHACIHKMIHFEKRKIKYTTIFYLYLKK